MSDKQLPSPPRTPVNSGQYLNVSPSRSTGSYDISPSSFASVSTVNTTGTALHHKSVPHFGIQQAEQLGIVREDDTARDSPGNSYDSTTKILRNNSDILAAMSRANSHDSPSKSPEPDWMQATDAHGERSSSVAPITSSSPPQQKPRQNFPRSESEADRIWKATFNSESRVINGDAKGYEAGRYVTKLGTDAQNKEIDNGLEEVRRRQRGCLGRMFGK